MAVEKKNIFLRNTISSLPYVSRSTPFDRKFPKRENPIDHATLISQKLQECREQSLTQKQVAAIRYKEGVYLEFSSAARYDLAIKSLENRQKGIRLLNVKTDSTSDIIKATVYIPAGQESYFLERVQAYAEPTLEGKNPKNNDLVRSIDDVKLAILDSFWVGDPKAMPKDAPVGCEVWLRYEQNNIKDVEDNFFSCCADLKIELNERHIVFPERVVRLIKTNNEQLRNMISECPFIAEIRRAPESTSYFDELTGSEQQEWVNELLSRSTFLDTHATICLLDRGLSYAHPLLAPAVRDQDVQAVERTWGTADDEGHGTEMAGIALYNDLKKSILDQLIQVIPHKIESVKILPPRGENQPELYGAITEQAVALAETTNPDAERVICMAITSSEYNTRDGSPTSWSAAVDSLTSGADGSNEKRLFFVSAGNVDPSELYAIAYPDANVLHCVDSPGQSWNALTVGAFTQDVSIESATFSGFSPVADVGELSPYSSTSVNWDSKWPIKPEILLDGGNVATNGHDFTSCPDLSLLTTNRYPLTRPFSTIWGTSSATAQAAWMAAQLYAEYPGIWPETVRALLVHSAKWTDKMREQFCREDSKSKGRRMLLRSCGYGIPNLDRAIQCLNNSVNLIIQDELQPFEKIGGICHMKEMHLHKLPWPTEVLRSLGETDIEMRVTLSYFIEPGPGEVGWRDKYRYPSCSLRFDVINSDETVEGFKKRINIKMRGEDKKDKGDGSSGSTRWYLGPDNRDVGSIHSDFYKDSAVNLCQANYVAVYPVIGWWHERSYLGRCDSKVRYSLIISLSTPKQDVDLYTPIITQISNSISAEISTS